MLFLLKCIVSNCSLALNYLRMEYYIYKYIYIYTYTLYSYVNISTVSEHIISIYNNATCMLYMFVMHDHVVLTAAVSALTTLLLTTLLLTTLLFTTLLRSQPSFSRPFSSPPVTRCKLKRTGELAMSFPSSIIHLLDTNISLDQIVFRLNNTADVQDFLPNDRLIKE